MQHSFDATERLLVQLRNDPYGITVAKVLESNTICTSVNQDCMHNNSYYGNDDRWVGDGCAVTGYIVFCNNLYDYMYTLLSALRVILF